MVQAIDTIEALLGLARREPEVVVTTASPSPLLGNGNTVIKNQVGGNAGTINQSGGNIAPIHHASDPVGTIHPRPAPTMKTLDQVEARTIVNAANTPGDTSNLFIITSSPEQAPE